MADEWFSSRAVRSGCGSEVRVGDAHVPERLGRRERGLGRRPSRPSEDEAERDTGSVPGATGVMSAVLGRTFFTESSRAVPATASRAR